MKCNAENLDFPCDGEVKEYAVKNSLYGWGKFHYCDAHAEEYRRRGFILTEINEKDQLIAYLCSRETVKELWDTIEFLNCKLEQSISINHFPKITSDLERDMINLIKTGKAIFSVKFMMNSTGCALKPAADTMRRLREEIWRGMHGEYDQNLVGKPPENFFEKFQKSA